jgi:cardiolipin synthase
MVSPRSVTAFICVVAVLSLAGCTADGVWSTIGSTNFDLWSFARNEEINAIILGVDFANQLEALFKKDKEESVEVIPEEWSVRPLFTRMREWMARLVSPWL